MELYLLVILTAIVTGVVIYLLLERKERRREERESVKVSESPFSPIRLDLSNLDEIPPEAKEITVVVEEPDDPLDDDFKKPKRR